jgi:MFS family permease
MYMAGIVNPYIMMAFTLLITSIESFNLPASGAFVPQVVNKEKLAHAMSLNTSLSSAVALVGTGAAGVIVAKLGVQTAMLIDAATFFLAAAFVMAIKTVAEEEMSEEEKSQAENTEVKAQTANADVIQNEAVETKSESYFAMLKDGIKYVAGNRVVVNYGILIVFLNFLLVPLNSIEAPIAEEVYGLGSELLSIMGMAASTGAILGSVITPIIMEKLSAKQIVITGGFTMGIFMYILSLGRLVYGSVIFGGILAGLCYFMMSAAGSVLGGSCMIRFVKMCDKEYLARAGAVMGATTAAAMPLGAIIVSIASATFNPAVLLSSVGILAIAFMTFVAFSNLDFELVGKEATDAA